MKKTFLALVPIAFLTFLACTKEPNTVHHTSITEAQQTMKTQYGILGRSNARYSSANYSQPISVDSANRMLNSYLHSVGYPSVDTALRSLNFDADTLRAYLQNGSIKTIKFMLAHQSAYINTGHENKNAGFSPSAITLVVVGLNNNDQYVLNSSNGVYDNMVHCPSLCPGITGPTIQ